jgi:hypothetical protein
MLGRAGEESESNRDETEKKVDIACKTRDSRWHEQVLFPLRPIDLAVARSAQVARREVLSEQDTRARLLMDFVRETQLQAARHVELIQAIRERGLEGRDYVEAVRNCVAVPLLGLPL